MKKIKTIHLNYLRNEAHYEYLVVFKNLLVRFPAIMSLLIAAVYEKFMALLQLEGKLVDAAKKSDYTQKIADADHRVDNDLIGLREAIVSATRHFDPAIADAAKSLYNRMKAFGSISQKSYEEETAAVNILLADLQGEYAQRVNIVGLNAWVTELAAAEAEFEQLLALRSEEAAGKPQERQKDVRREIDVVYHQLTERIDANAVIAEPGTYDEFIDLLNVEITYFNEHTHRHARKDLSVGDHTVVEPIPTQPYTGKAVTVIPKVHYREDEKKTVELVFAVDFSVTYKNNKDVGTANLIIHGKGKYRGQKTVTFNIAR
jgi:hypothetical protein